MVEAVVREGVGSEEKFTWADVGSGNELVSSPYSVSPSGSTEYETGMSSGGGEDVDDGGVNRGRVG